MDVVVLMFGIVVATTMGFFGFLSIWRIRIVPGAVADIVAFRRSLRTGQHFPSPRLGLRPVIRAR